ncbi:MAG: NADH-quinone oxidoreductase subunit C [Myxococcota bacterium]
MSTFALDQIQAQIPQALVERYTDRAGDAWGVIAKEHIVEVAKLLKEKLGFRLFISMDAVDRLHLEPHEQDPRFEVLYFLRNIERNEMMRLKVRVNEGVEIPSIMKVYQGAEWGERFVWDFYGVVFTNGIKRRMLMYEEFVGHPLRKDYPLRGRQNLVAERPIKDIFRGPGTNGVQD